MWTVKQFDIQIFSICTFERCLAPSYFDLLTESLCRDNFGKIKKIITGGEKRYHSSWEAIRAYDENENINLIIHDAVRPLLSHRIIDDCLAALKKHNAVDVAVASTDTIISVDKNNFINSIPDRECLRNGQTPQCFKIGVIKKAYLKAFKDPAFRSTDDCGIVRTYLPDEKIFVVKGDAANMKLTFKEDLYLIDKFFQLKSLSLKAPALSLKKQKILKGRVIVVFGGSSGIGKAIVNQAGEMGAIIYSFSRSENSTDVSIPFDVRNAFKKVNQAEGVIDIVVNTAGVLHRLPLNSMDYAAILESVNTNYLGTVTVAKESLEYLKKSRGSLLLFTSSSYTRGRGMYSVYSSLKAGIVNFMQAISSEWQDYGVKVNCVNPERTKTPMRLKHFETRADRSLLDARTVARASLQIVLSDMNGMVVDVRKSSP